MKIGILTYHCQSNFGAQLQAISTVGYFKRMGHEPIVLHWYPKDLEEMLDKRIPSCQTQCHKQFTEEVLPISNLCRTTSELVSEIERLHLEAIFLGADALFKYTPLACRRRFSLRRIRFVDMTPLSCQDLIDNPFFGEFGSRLSKKLPISVFSVSSQNCPFHKMTEAEKEKMNAQMQNFSHITVRDEWTKEMVETITGREHIQITPDPVFSFNQNLYLDIPSKEDIIKKFGLAEDYVLLSFSDWYNKVSYIKEIASEIKRQDLQPVALPMPEKLFDAGIEKRVDLPLTPLDWYALIKYSKGYIGERMHPIIVSIHNEIPFVVFDEYGTIDWRFGGLIRKHHIESSKTYLILQRAGLLRQLYSYHSHLPMPSAKKVVEMLITFDKMQCHNFAESYQKLYELEMNNIINSYIS